MDFAINSSLLSQFTRWGVDSQGNILILANPTSCTLPTVNPLYACGPLWVGKLDASGQRLLFATYLGSGPSSAYTAAAGIAADSSGNVILAAHSTAADLPAVNAIQSAPQSNLTNLYVAKISADGSQLIYATYLGGTGAQSAYSLAVDAAGAAYVAGTTTTADFPSTPSSVHEPVPNPSVVVKVSPEGKLQYADTFSTDLDFDLRPIQVDAAGRAVLSSKTHVVTVSADGSSLQRTDVPAWAIPPDACTPDGSGGALCSGKPWILPRSSGGWQFAGVAAGGVPVPADAMETYQDANGYARIENGQAAYPQLAGPVSGFATDPQAPSRIYAATSSGLYLSGDNGRTWWLIFDGPALAIAVDPFDSNRLYLSVDMRTNPFSAPQIYRSTDRGVTWNSIYSGAAGNFRITSLAADPNVQGLLYGAGPSLFRSTDGGDTWTSRSVGPSRPDQSPSASTSTASYSVIVDPTHAGWAYVVGTTRCIGFCPVTQNLSRTQDGGKTWSNATTAPDPSISGAAVPLLAVDPNTGDVVESSSGLGSAWIYRNGDFSRSEVLYPAETSAVLFDPQNKGTIYLGVHITKGPGNGFFVVKSVDGGQTWSPVIQLDRAVYNLTLGPGGVLHATQAPNLPQGYVMMTDASGNVQHGTYLGSTYTQINSVVQAAGRLFIAGQTQGGLPLVDAMQSSANGGADGFLAEFDDSGALLWSTYLGGSADDSIDWVLPLPDGSVVVVGTTHSTDFPSLAPSPLGSGETFIAHLRP